MQIVPDAQLVKIAIVDLQRDSEGLGPPFCGDECRAERALGCGRIFPCGQQAGATGEEAAEEGNARAAQ